MDTPVLFLIFNRPDLTSRVFQRIREARPPRLYVAADGPRDARSGEASLCSETRLVTENVDWPCDVKRLYRDRNLGCKHAVSSAISWFFEQEEAGIILEDDCLPDPTFFPFCRELLKRYEHDSRVAAISGDNFQKTRVTDDSYYFSKFPHIWGWATWRRAWNMYDVDLSEWPAKAGFISKHLADPHLTRYFANIFDQVKNGTIDTWDYQFAFLCFATGSFSICPAKNLVENIGFDERATHTRSANDSLPAGSIPPPFKHPSTLESNPEADAFTARKVFDTRPAFLRRCVNYLSKFIH